MKKILVCTNHRANPNNPSCGARGSKQLLVDLTQKCYAEKVNIAIVEVQCLGLCNVGPNMRLMPNGAFFNHVSADNFNDIIVATKQFINK